MPAKGKIARVRFIPTGVGNTVRQPAHRGRASVHPHGCGEHQAAGKMPLAVAGSSPRVWGTLFGRACLGGGPRFIPTGVGNTAICRPSPAPMPVHPHGCGEHAVHMGKLALDAGSSPRVWGTHGQRRRRRSPRFIPTGVGNTRAQSGDDSGTAVHPHGCGEHIILEGQNVTLRGSSPRVWGTHPADRADVSRCRFIPTGVGNTPARPRRCPHGQVHPHGCGEHSRPSVMVMTDSGSSPRVWGTPAGGGVMRALWRFIPTGVGNT